MKKLLCTVITLIFICSVVTFAFAAFDSSVFEGKDGYSVQEADGSWIYFRGVVFNDIGDKGVQLSLQADSSGKDHAPVLRLFALVTNSREKSVSDFGTPEGLRLYINGNRQADIRLTDRYGNPACASVTLAGEGESLCRLLADLNSLSFDVSFEGNDQILSYELTGQNVDVFRRTIGSMCGILLESGIFDAIRENGAADDSAWITMTELPAEPEDRAANTPEPTAEPTLEPTVEFTAEPTPEPAAKPTLEPTIAPTTEPTPEPTVEPTVEPTLEPTVEPTAEPTPEPVPEPTAEPALKPTVEPTAEPAAEVPASGSAETTQSFSGIRTGDIVRMGSYVQDDPAKREPIEWQVLTVNKKAGQALLLSVRALDAVAFGEGGNTEEYNRVGLNWENSAVRNWLNGDFYAAVFSDTEKDRILETALRTKDRAGSHHTDDRVFLLNAQEAMRYLRTAKGMACKPTAYTLAKLRQDSQAVSPEGYCCWMLRELVRVPGKNAPGGQTQRTGNEVGYVNQNHALRLFYQWVGCPVWQYDLCAIRPAMWIRIN